MPSRESRRIAIVEDDTLMGATLVQRLEIEGYAAEWWRTGSEAIAGLKNRRPDLLVCDIRLPDMDGEQVFRAAMADLASTPVLFITAFAELEQAIRLMRAGADDYLTKPFEMSGFLERIDGLLGQSAAVAKPSSLGTSPAMGGVEALLRRVADIDSTLLLSGESGVGKEVAARFVHSASGRVDSPFMAVNCAAIPSELIDSELFGHEKGAFTGAHARHEGYAERAGEGVLFLDEISELPPPVQAKLLRLIQERVFSRVGGERLLPFRARVVCATNVDLERHVADGRFRQDLFFRINVIPVTIPPLRERRDDILPLLDSFIASYAKAFGRPARRASERAEAMALGYAWPGNVRELRNRVERAVALCSAPVLGPADLFPESAADESTGEDLAPLTEVRDLAERAHILTAIEKAGSIPRAAELLGIARSTLFEKVRRFGIKAPSLE